MQDEARDGGRRGRGGFTLIELLIVVSIISILASMALPNFLEAQVRARVARAKSDLRTCAIGLEMYCVDNGWYPDDDWSDEFQSWDHLTTPIAYLPTVYLDPFSRDRRPFEYSNSPRRVDDKQNAAYQGARCDWFTFSRGPDLTITWNWTDNGSDGSGEHLLDKLRDSMYDPTNGTASRGDVYRTSRGQEE